MKIKLLSLGTTISLLLTMSNLVTAQTTEQKSKQPPQISALCEKVLCRTPQVNLLLKDGQKFSDTGAFALPFLQNEWISIYSGEEVFIEATIEADKLQLVRAVPSITKPEQTLVFKLDQKPGTTDMFLEVKNPFNKKVKFSMGMMLPNSAKLQGTTSCPVQPGLKLFEHWPHPIYQLYIGKARILPEAEQSACTQ